MKRIRAMPNHRAHRRLRQPGTREAWTRYFYALTGIVWPHRTLCWVRVRSRITARLRVIAGGRA